MVLYLGTAVVTFAVFSYLWFTVVPDSDDKTEKEADDEEEIIFTSASTPESMPVGGPTNLETEDGSLATQLSQPNVKSRSEDSKPESSSHDPKEPTERLREEHSTPDLDLVSRMALEAGVQNSLQSSTCVSSYESKERVKEIDCNVLQEQDQTESVDAAEDYIIIADRSPRDQLLSEPFIMLASFFTIQVTASVWAQTTARDFLAYLGDDEYGNRYLSIFTLLGPASMVAVPCVDKALNDYGFHASLQFVNALALGYTGIKVVSDNLNVQIIGFVLFSFYRSFLFSTALTCLPTIVSRDLVGRSIGVFNIASGLFGFVNIPLANFAVNQLGGNFTIPNLFFFALNIPCVFLIWRLGRGLGRESAVKDSTQRTTQTSLVSSHPADATHHCSDLNVA